MVVASMKYPAHRQHTMCSFSSFIFTFTSSCRDTPRSAGPRPLGWHLQAPRTAPLLGLSPPHSPRLPH